MVAKIKSGKSIRGILMYNEQKVGEGCAVCIGASNYGLEAQELNFSQKLARFEKLMEKNARTKTNALHISLNFDPSEKFTKAQLNEMAETYMQKIGFGGQPYLVYEHHDAAHTHIHIATTNIRADGRRLDIYNIGKNQSETARKQMEIEFGLIKAEGRKQQQQLTEIIGLKPKELIYGKSQTKRTITNIVGNVMEKYKFASLAEYNAVLKCYGITASRGAESTRMFKGKGLVYQAIDKKGKLLGASVKASAIYGQPTLNKLEGKFEKNKQLKYRYKTNLKLEIDKAINQKPKNHKALEAVLKMQQIDVIYRTNTEQRIYGVTFIDHKHKVVMNGSELGKSYGIKGLEERMGIRQNAAIKTQQKQVHPKIPQAETNQYPKDSLLDILLKSPEDFSQMPKIFRKKRKRRRQIIQH